MSEPIFIDCAKCGQKADVTATVEFAVGSGHRSLGWRPKVCGFCLLNALATLDANGEGDQEVIE